MVAKIICAIAALASLTAAAAPPPPNILVIYSDDHGWADLAIQGADPDIRTPHLDQLARDGVRFPRGYVSAPQCVPSRAGLITGRYQQRFGVEDNNHGPLPLAERTIAELLAPAGYTSGWIGKCHLDIGGEKRKGEGYHLLPDHMPHHQGFAEYFRGELRRYEASHDLEGRPFPDAPHRVVDERFRVVVQTDAAISFLDRRAQAPGKPWFLYLAWYAPHVPLESPEPWFSQTPESLPLARRQALAMVAAMDDGLGRIRTKLREMGAEQNTLIVFAGDNGAPLGKAWNGSLNAPLAGQKGMLAEGGIRTPFIGAWPGTWPAGTTYDEPVINLDIAATAIAAAGLAPDASLDGVDLTPFVTGRRPGPPHEHLFWRWGSQAAVLEMPYKLITLGDHAPLLFDVTQPEGEHHDRDLAASHPEIVARLTSRLEAWAAHLQPPGLSGDSSGSTRHHEKLFAEHHLTATARPAAQTTSMPKKPNVILFLVDDMGWMDSSPYGSQYYDTPTIARLAGQGMRFTRAYAQPLCSPTRACLLTGKNAARHGITSAVGHTAPAEQALAESGPPAQPFVYPTSKTFLDPAEHTLAEAFRDAGYRTGHFGKWHLGLTDPHWPEAQGFDVAFHCHPDAGPPNAYFSPYGVTPPGGPPAKGRKRIVGTITDGPAGEYITDRLTDEAIRFVETSVQENAGRPFFLNLWHYGVHGPWCHKESLTAEMAKRTDPTGRQGNPVMASMLKSIDESLGRLLDTLDRLGIADDTIVIFTSDNGGNTHSMTDDAGAKKRRDDASDPTTARYRKWAGFKPPTNNAPLREGKGTLYEGGVRVPLVVRFPGRIKPGTTSDALVGCTDIYPTLLDLAGVAADPAQVKDGISYAGVLRGTAAHARDDYVIWFPGRPHGAAAYAGDWKLIRRQEPAPQGDGSTRELYNLANDLGETNNLAIERPEKVKELEGVIDRLLADSAAVVPKPNPAYRGKPADRRQAAAPPAARPNVLWIYLEDVSGWFSCYGEKLIATPHIDRLAAQGTRFTRFYTSAGVCSATRSAVMLGAMQTTYGVHHHRSSRNMAVGTKHDGIGMIHLPEGVVPLPQWCRQHGVYTFNDGCVKDDFNFVFRRADFYDFCVDEKTWGPARTLTGDCWRGREPGQPFFGQVQLAGGKLGQLWNGPPPTQAVDRATVPVPPYYPDIPEVREEIGRHYDCLVKTDEQVGEILAALQRDGLADSTVVILFSDHGYGLHRHKQFLYEGGIHMPLIVAGPGIPPGSVRDDLTSSIDVAPTTLGILGLPIPSHMEGRDLFSATYTPREFVVAARDRCDYTIERIRAIVTQKYKYLRNYLTDRPYMQPSYKDPWPVTIRLREMMARNEMNDVQNIFFGDAKPAEELYDLENDPHEIKNLAADPAHLTALEHHRKLLADWVAATGDKGQEPEDDAGLIQVLYEWGEKCVNPEYDRLRDQIEPRKKSLPSR